MSALRNTPRARMPISLPGGHFMAAEEPALLAVDIREAFRRLRYFSLPLAHLSVLAEHVILLQRAAWMI